MHTQKHTLQTKIKMSNTHKTSLKCKEAIIKRSTNLNWKKNLSKAKKGIKFGPKTIIVLYDCKVCGIEKEIFLKDYLRPRYVPKYCGYTCTWKARTGVSTRNTRNHVRGEKHHWYGTIAKNFPNRANCKYKGITMRSSWEVIMAGWLDKIGVTWEYEPTRFRYKDEECTYLPDFYVKEWNKLIEVKGYIRKEWMDKMYYVMEYSDESYPKILLATQKMITAIKQGIV